MISKELAINTILNLNVEHNVSWKDAAIDALDALPENTKCKDCIYRDNFYCIYFKGYNYVEDTDYCSHAIERQQDG